MAHMIEKQVDSQRHALWLQLLMLLTELMEILNIVSIIL